MDNTNTDHRQLIKRATMGFQGYCHERNVVYRAPDLATSYVDEVEGCVRLNDSGGRMLAIYQIMKLRLKRIAPR